MPSLIPATARTLAVFEIFAREKRALSNSEMARLLSLRDSSSLDLLHSLHSLGYLMRTPRTLRYYPTGRLFETAQQINQNDPLTTVAREAVEQLGERTGESAFFGILDRHAVKVIAAQPSSQPLRYVVEVGDRVSLNASALGKSLLGLHSDEEAEALIGDATLRAVTDRTLIEPKRLLADVARGRERGWYEAVGEGGEGVSGLAIAGWIGDHPAGLSLAGPSERMQKNRDSYLESLREVSATLLR
jgi:DNA-binding IclR family transcriptional regulator